MEVLSAKFGILALIPVPLVLFSVPLGFTDLIGTHTSCSTAVFLQRLPTVIHPNVLPFPSTYFPLAASLTQSFSAGLIRTQTHAPLTDLFAKRRGEKQGNVNSMEMGRCMVTFTFTLE